MGDDLSSVGYDALLGDIIEVVDQARSAAVRGVNTVMTTSYWLVGRRIIEEEQAESAEPATVRASWIVCLRI